MEEGNVDSTSAHAAPSFALERLKGLDPTARRALLERMGRAMLDGNELVAEALGQCGVQRMSGMMGVPVDAVFRACQKRLRVLGFRHQVNAALASAADNYASGRLVHAVCVSSGPAVLNAINGVYFARDNHWPLLLLGSRRSLDDEGRGYFQELNAVPILQPLTKWAATVREPGQIMPMIHEAIRVATSGQPGPVFLDLPETVLEGKAVPVKLDPPVRKMSGVVEGEINEAWRLLQSARAPLLCLGEELRWETELRSLLAFLEREQIPWMTTPLARGILPETHPLCANGARRRLTGKCDCFLLAGAWFDWRFRYGAELAPDARIIHVYPDENRLGRNVPIALPIKADGGAVLNALSKKDLSERTALMERSDWLETTRREGIASELKQDQDISETSAGMHPRLAYRAIQAALPDTAMITVDGNITLTHVQSSIYPHQPYSWIDPGWNGLIGGSLALAIGLKLARPERPVVAFMSDTSFGMSGMELETCVRHNINVVAVVGNNGGNTGMHRDRNWFPPDAEAISVYGDLDYHEIGRVLGTEAGNLQCVDDIAPGIAHAFSAEQPTCLNLKLDPDAASAGAW